MTIVVQGHIESVEVAGLGNRIAVRFRLEYAVCREPITLLVPIEHSAHWMAGRRVQVTAFAYDAPKPPAERAAAEPGESP